MNGSISGRPARLEPLFWSLARAGGFVAAALGPVSVAVVLLLAPLGFAPSALDPNRLVGLITNPAVKLGLAVLLSLPMFHAAHRIRFLLVDLGIRAWRGPVAVACFASAGLCALWAVVVVWQIH